MTLMHILFFSLAALLYAALLPARWRGWMLLIASVVAIYWLQPALPVRNLDFILPTATLVLAMAGWLATKPAPTEVGFKPTLQGLSRDDLLTLAVTVALVLGLSATRYLAPELRPTPSRAPDTLAVALGLIVAGGVLVVLWRLLAGRRSLPGMALLAVVALFVLINAGPTAAALSGALRRLAGQSADLAQATDIGWLGFSYVAFRLIHTLRERQTGKLPALSLREYLTYLIFFPAFTAGPIDRAERFVQDYRRLFHLPGLDAARITEGTARILVGLCKKFVVADSLALFALNATNAGQAQSAGALWLLLYGYALRLFLDFSGYSDIAIGIGILYGVRLPENFDRPYLRTNITAFWQNWHMTLSSWARFYVFSPLSRALLGRNVAPQLAVFLCQMATMLVIGLWHGITPTFVVWGAWHGVGLFVHKLWSDRTRKWYLSLKDRPRVKQAWSVAGWLITLQFVVLGWVWFALPDLGAAWNVLVRLFGLA